MSNPLEGKPPPDVSLGPESTASHNSRQLVGCLPVLGSLAVGFFGIIFAFVAFFNGTPPAGPGQPTTGLCLIASALAFGLLANAIWRK